MRRTIIPGLCLLIALSAGPGILAGEDDVAARYEAGRKAEAARDFKTALAEYEKGMDIDEDYKDLFERWEAALELADWQEDVEGEPTAMDLVRLGEAYLKIGRIGDERAVYEEALELDPSCSEAHGHLALANYAGGAGGSLVTVMKETIRFLETSPRREKLTKALEDFKVYGLLRIMRAEMSAVLRKAGEARKAEDLHKAAKILENATLGDIPDAYRTVLFTEAAKLRLRNDDSSGARRALTWALEHAVCTATLEARMGLAALHVREGELEAALEHLRAAVAEGSGACRSISSQREKALKPLFEAEDEEIRAEAERLTDPEEGDAPIRAEIEAALEKAKAEGKQVLLHWYGPYCPYVMAMEDRLAVPEVAKLIEEHFVHVRMSQGGGHRGLSLDAEYGNVMRNVGVPGFFILKEDGGIKTVQKDISLWGAPHRDYDVEKILQWLKSEIEDRE